MAGSTYGTILKMTTWGESHGAGIGVAVDGCPAGLALDLDDIQMLLDRRKPGQSRFTTKRSEGDQVEILSGIFEGRTTGTPIAMLVRNEDQHSRDYSEIAGYYRPGHADFTFDAKYGFRDYRGGGRSSGRETIGRVAAGAVAKKLLESLGVSVKAYTKAIGPVAVAAEHFELEECSRNKLYMPDAKAAREAERFLEQQIAKKDSAGGVVECVISGLPAGVGEPVFEKLSANLAKAVCSIGAVKGFEIGDGFAASKASGLENNDAFMFSGVEEAFASGDENRTKETKQGADENRIKETEQGADENQLRKTEQIGKDNSLEKDNFIEEIRKATNHSGGVLGGISDGSQIVFRAAFKPTPSIAAAQKTVNQAGEEIEIRIGGRHDPIIVPRAVVVVEAMAAFTVADMLLLGMTSRLDRIQRFFGR